jgi:hypothetical protein
MALSNTARIGTATNLETGGTYDLLMVKFQGTFPEGQITFGLYDTPMKITGLQKVVQIFLKVLLTSKGSDPVYPSRGTFFPNLTTGANVAISDSLLLSELKDAIRDAETQVRSYLNVNTADITSCLDSVQVLGMDTIDEGVVMYLKATTLSGDFASVAVPFPEFGLAQ